jgi:hypothetical protein
MSHDETERGRHSVRGRAAGAAIEQPSPAGAAPSAIAGGAPQRIPAPAPRTMQTTMAAVLFLAQAGLSTGYYGSSSSSGHNQGAVAAAPEPPLWEDWVRVHARVYGSRDEAERRRQIYLREAVHVRSHNARASRGAETYTVAVNKWSDLTHAEWAAQMGLTVGGLITPQTAAAAAAATPNATYHNGSSSSSEPAFFWLPEDGALGGRGAPTSLDWRARGAVTPVKNQGGCGACWSFGATGTMEGAWFLAGHKLASLSEEQLIHCSGQNCGGGNPGHAIDYVVHNHGIDSERDYRYTAKNGRCDGLKAGRHVAAMAAARNVPQRNERQLMAAVLRQVSPKRLVVDSPWSQLTSECQRF